VLVVHDYGAAVANYASILPDRIEGNGVLLRRWVESDADALARAVTESVDHLRPWMAWMAEEPQSVEERRNLIARWEREWSAGGDVALAIFIGEEVAGSCGLHRRRGPRTLELGYWIHPKFVGQGIATTAARLLTDAAFTVPGITYVEIHHDKANRASARVPRRLGFRFIGEAPDQREAPGELGIDCMWRVDHEHWRRCQS
jgi:ribosomal-protein-serine acetyltransferase